MLYEPAQFEPLTDEPWDPAHIEEAIATIVADADAAFDSDALWPAHEWDGWQTSLPLKNLYVGAAGVIWALDALRRRGHAETSLDLADAALRTLELERGEPVLVGHPLAGLDLLPGVDPGLELREALVVGHDRMLPVERL